MSDAAPNARSTRRVVLLDKLFDAGLTDDEQVELDALQMEAGRQRVFRVLKPPNKPER